VLEVSLSIGKIAVLLSFLNLNKEFLERNLCKSFELSVCTINPLLEGFESKALVVVFPIS
jgi:hypothetical protein